MDKQEIDVLIVPYAPKWMRPGYVFVLLLAVVCLFMALFFTDKGGDVTYDVRGFFALSAALLATFCYFKIKQTAEVLLDRDGRLFSRIDMIGRRTTVDLGKLSEVYLFPGRNEREDKVFKLKLAGEGDDDLAVAMDTKREVALAKAKQTAAYLRLPLRDESLEISRLYSPDELGKSHQQRLKEGDLPAVETTPTADCEIVSSSEHELELRLPSLVMPLVSIPFFIAFVVLILSRLTGDLGPTLRVLVVLATAAYLLKGLLDSKFPRTLAVKEGAVFLIQERPKYPSSISILLSDLDEVSLNGSALHFVHGLRSEVLEFKFADDAAWTKEQLDAFLYQL